MRIDPETCRDPVLLAAEVRRLRNVLAADDPWLTDAEREALKDAADILEDLEDDDGNSLKPEAATLRGLLERTK